MKKSCRKAAVLAITFCVAQAAAFAQSPCIPGFEPGNFNGWAGGIGDNITNSNVPLQNQQYGIYSQGTDAPIMDCNARHTIVSAVSGNDPCGGFPVVHSGQYSARLGGQCGNYQGEFLELLFMPDPSNPVADIFYALVLQDGGHSASEEPYFRIEMFDQSNNLVPGGQLFVTTTDSGFTACTPPAEFKPWDTLSVNLASYLGQVIRMRATVAGCIYAGHYGYAYLDMGCGVITGMNEFAAEKASVFPNPSSSRFSLQLPAEAFREPPRLRARNLLGQEVPVAWNRNAAGQIDIDAASWAKGVYLLEIESGGKRMQFKLIRE